MKPVVCYHKLVFVNCSHRVLATAYYTTFGAHYFLAIRQNFVIMNLTSLRSIKSSAKKRIKKFMRALKGDYFSNAGAVTEMDLQLLRDAIDQVKPTLFIEIGTGTGASSRGIFQYILRQMPTCDFYTMDIFNNYLDDINKVFGTHPNFHTVLGLSVLRDEITDPAYTELSNYQGPTNSLRKLLDVELKGRMVDIAFIDSRKGTAVPEFHVLAERLSPNGIIFCHDILNGGKGVELATYLREDEGPFSFEIINTGPAGMIRIQRRGS